MIKQDDIFGHNQDSIQFAELCNALYQRECQILAESSSTQINLLKRKLKFLPQLVQECARGLLNNQAALSVDYYNASYQAKQAATCPSLKQSIEIISHTTQNSLKLGGCYQLKSKPLMGTTLNWTQSIELTRKTTFCTLINTVGFIVMDSRNRPTTL